MIRKVTLLAAVFGASTVMAPSDGPGGRANGGGGVSQRQDLHPGP